MHEQMPVNFLLLTAAGPEYNTVSLRNYMHCGILRGRPHMRVHIYYNLRY